MSIVMIVLMMAEIATIVMVMILAGEIATIVMVMILALVTGIGDGNIYLRNKRVVYKCTCNVCSLTISIRETANSEFGFINKRAIVVPGMNNIGATASF